MARSWCMHYESKHTYFKQVAIALGNYVNVPYTVADRENLLKVEWLWIFRTIVGDKCSRRLLADLDKLHQNTMSHKIQSQCSR